MDELVFAREALRRGMLEAVSLLEKAADNYDPASDLPPDDIIAAIHVTSGLRKQVLDYSEQLTHRVQTRAAAKRERET